MHASSHAPHQARAHTPAMPHTQGKTHTPAMPHTQTMHSTKAMSQTEAKHRASVTSRTQARQEHPCHAPHQAKHSMPTSHPAGEAPSKKTGDKRACRTQGPSPATKARKRQSPRQTKAGSLPSTEPRATAREPAGPKALAASGGSLPSAEPQQGEQKAAMAQGKEGGGRRAGKQEAAMTQGEASSSTSTVITL